MNTVTLPWPPKECSPNARVHWSVKARAAKAYRKTCFVLTKAANLTLPHRRQFALIVTFNPPDNRRRDDDNLLTAFKSGRDGIADGLGVDDCCFELKVRISDNITKGGSVTVRFSNTSDWPQFQDIHGAI